MDFVLHDSAKSESFKDSFGFIHGSRESESEVFHYVCRELTRHYSSFYKVCETNLLSSRFNYLLHVYVCISMPCLRYEFYATINSSFLLVGGDRQR